MLTSLLSRTRVARRLDIDPRTLSKVLASEEIAPDFKGKKGDFFAPDRLPEIRSAVRERFAR